MLPWGRKTLAMTGALLVSSLLFALPAKAATIGLTITSDKDPLTVVTDDVINFLVGLDLPKVITGYTLDIRYDMTELMFISSAQLVTRDVTIPGVGTFTVPFDYELDPADEQGDSGSSGLATSNSGRASFLGLEESNPVINLLGLSFKVINPVGDGLEDLLVGILNSGADDINPVQGGDPFIISPDVVSASVGGVSTIPIPAAIWLMGSAVFGLVAVGRRRVAV